MLKVPSTVGWGMDGMEDVPWSPVGDARLAEAQVFFDPVYKLIRLPSFCRPVIDTAEFQRTRELVQLGAVRFVFQGAEHNRFSHMLGTAYQAQRVAGCLLRRQGSELGMEADDVRLVVLAALCHDLGHGPASHGFDRFLQRMNVKDWHHEDMSGRLLQLLVDNNNLDCLSGEDIRRITDLIRGRPPALSPQEQQQQQPQQAPREGADGPAGTGAAPGSASGGDKRFLFDIVANKRNGVDVDKFDYLQRDAMHCGVSVGCNYGQLVEEEQFKVLDNELCYHWRQYGNILEMFNARAVLHRTVYTMHTCKAAELMYVDAMAEANPLLRITDRLHDPQEFMSLNDSILSTIEHYDKNHRCRSSLDDTEERALRSAQGVVARLRRRQLYRFTNQFTVPPEALSDGRWEAMRLGFTAEEVASCYGGGEVALRPEDLIVDENRIDYGSGGSNPLDRIGFFRHYSDTRSFPVRLHQIVGIMPAVTQERVLRVFTRQDDERYVRAAEEALINWSAARFGSGAQLATPLRQRPQQQQQQQQQRGEPPPMMLSREAAQASFQGDLLRGGPAAAALRHGTPPPSQPATGSGPVGTPPRQSPTANGFAMADGSPAGPVAQPAAGAGAAGAGAAGQAGGPGPGQGQGHDGEASGAAGRSKRLRT